MTDSGMKTVASRAKINIKKNRKKDDIVKQIQNETRNMLLPNIYKKMNEVAKYIEEKVSKSHGLTISQILPLISKRSVEDIVNVQHKGYTPQELAEAFNIYIDMIGKINEVCKFPPNKGTFCSLLGISKQTYDAYMCDPDKVDIMGIIDNYISTSVVTSAQLGELREISSIFTLKSQHGYMEAKAPVVIEHKKETDIDDITAQLEALKQDNVIDAEWEEKDE